MSHLQNYGRINFCCLKPQVCGTLLGQPSHYRCFGVVRGRRRHHSQTACRSGGYTDAVANPLSTSLDSLSGRRVEGLSSGSALIAGSSIKISSAIQSLSPSIWRRNLAHLNHIHPHIAILRTSLWELLSMKNFQQRNKLFWFQHVDFPSQW